MIAIGILVPPIKSMVQLDSLNPMESALNLLDSSQILTVFGSSLFVNNNTVWMKGTTIMNDRKINVFRQIDAIHDRFPSQGRFQHFKTLYDIGKNIPFANPYQSTLLTRDKVGTQRLLEQHGCRMPTLITNPDLFVEALQDWGDAFIKPQYGAFGQNVQYIQAQNAPIIPKSLEGLVAKQMEPTILQKAVRPLKGWAGLSVRQLAQRLPGGSWILRPPVLRCSTDDPVVNVARGAEAIPAEDMLSSACITEIKQQSLLACHVLSQQENGHLNVEFGLDFVIDQDECPWLIEVNSRPRGKLAELARKDPARFQKIHQESMVAPIKFLASLFLK